MKKRSAKTKCPCLRPLALAAAMLLGPALPALAQSFSQSGVNGTSPNNLLPYSGSPTSLDFTGDAVYIGSGAIGSFSVLAGALLKADSLSVGTGGNGIGTFTASGRNASTLAPSTVQLGALDVGSWGVGTATVSNGGLIDATFCSGPSAGCSSVVGNAAGATGTLTVTGAGSEVRTVRNFTVGQTAVFTLAADGFDFGTPGGTTNATVNVLAGGTLRTEGAVVGRNSMSTSGNGNEKAIGTVTVSGSGSSWNVGHNSIDNAASGMTIGANVGGQGSVVVSNGGSLLLDASNGVVNGNDFITIGVAGGKGSLTISGAGSNLTLATSGAIHAGRSNGSGGVVGDGSFSVLAGATASATFLNVGRDGANGTVLIDGTGSTLTLSDMGPYASGGVGAAVGTIGWVGTGKVTVSNGALWQINDGGADTSANGGRGPGLTIGTVGGTGTVEIKGAGAQVSLTSSSIAPAPGNPDNANPYVNLGIGAGSTGTLDISDGGKLLLHGGALSTPTYGRGTTLSIGGNSDTTPGGTGTVNVSGSGSEIRMTGTDAYVVVGRGGTGTLNLSDGALLEATIINVGRVGNGTMTMDAASVELAGQFTDNNGSGAAVSVGNRGGTASLSMANASTIAITNLGSAGASFNLGGTGPNPLGTGTLTMTGGSQITVTAASGLASASIGRDGSGTVTMQGSSRFDIGDGTLHVGRLPTGTGMLSIESGSTFLAGVANIGGSSDADAGGMGSVVVQGLGSELSASGASGFVGVGRNGTGTLTLSDQAKLSAIITAVGRGNGGVGTLTASNATLELAGQQTAGLMSGASMSIGSGGGSGSATLSNSTVSITNMGSAGATLNVGGSGAFPGGTGTLVMTNSQLTVTAAAGQGTVSIGRTGSGTAVLDNSSITDVGGNVYVARETGSTGVLALTNGSTVTADFVGIGVSAKYDGVTQATSGSGVLVLNDSTLRTAGFELGAGSVLTGSGGTIEIIPSSGDVVIGGTIAPGNSPGRLRIRCNIIMLPGSRIVLEVQGTGDFYEIDELVIDSASSFDLASAQIEFSFLGDTNPNEFAALGGMNLDNFFRAETGTTTAGLSTVFATGQTWSTVVDTATITATSSAYTFTEFSYSGDGSITLSAVPVPEPSTWGMMFVGLAAVGAFARRRQMKAAV